jgi:hypothetical protein
VTEKIRGWYEHPFFGTGYPTPAAFKIAVRPREVVDALERC